ncbi:MAG TPA: hypothetical protein DCS48_14305 [Desulfovibrio sp.]|nr:hypothetical protein [Desulfovibrio sp.]
MSQTKAVIFDFDGVLGKTMEDNYRAWHKAFERHGVSISEEKYYLLEGLNTRKVAEAFINSYGLKKVSPEDVARAKEDFYMQDNSFSFYPGAVELVKKCAAHCLTGLVSGASYPRLERTAGKNFLSLFEAVVTGDRVGNPKPNPEPYLTGADILGVKPQDCIAVENAPLGIDSAKEAGMRCIAITSTLDSKKLARADEIVGSIDAVYSFLNLEE